MNALLSDARTRADAEARQREELAQRLQAVVELEADARESREQRLMELEESLAQAEGSAREAWRQVESRGEPGDDPLNGAAADRHDNASDSPEDAEKRGQKARRRVSQTQTSGTSCSICQAARPEGAAAEGWIQQGDVLLCGDCQAEGWQIPEGATMPARRLSDRHS